MFDSNEEFSAKVDSLVKACGAKSRGDMILHAEIRKILGCRPYQGCWTAAVQKMIKRVEAELGITLMNVLGVGYRLAPLDDQFGIAPRKRIKRAMRQIARGIKHVEAPVAEEVPPHLARQRAFLSEGLRQKRSTLHGEAIRQGMFARREDTPPRIPFFKQPD